MTDECNLHRKFGPAEVEDVLRTAGLRRTELRLALLEIFARRQRPVSQGTILEALGGRGLRGADRVSVYRNLNQFLAAGLIHEVATNSYVTCQHHDAATADAHVLLFCTECQRHQEVCRRSDRALFDRLIGTSGFFAADRPLLISGRCRACTTRGA